MDIGVRSIPEPEKGDYIAVDPSRVCKVNTEFGSMLILSHGAVSGYMHPGGSSWVAPPVKAEDK